jgi:glycosyltransferase involved in cell wall biosynthesis
LKEVLVIVPAYNEEKNIEKVVEELKRDMPCADILIVNDASKDNTLEVIKRLDVNYLTLPFNLGYSGVLQCGFKFAVEKGYNYVVQFDGDGQHIALEAKRVFETLLNTGADIVLGSRFKYKSDYKHSFFRKVGTKMFQLIIKFVCKKEISDPTTGLQALSRRVFERYSKMNNYPEYPDANLIIEMLYENYQIEEVHVKMAERQFGESMHSGILKPAKYMVNMFYSIILILIRNFEMKRYE